MSMNEKLLAEVSNYIIRAMDDNLTDEEFSNFQDLLKANPAAREYYFDILQTVAGIEESEGLSESGDDQNVSSLLYALADDEKTAPAVALSGEKTPTLVQDVRQRKKLFQDSQKDVLVKRRRLITAITCLAAFLFLLIYVQMMPQPVSEAVATLKESVGARWVDGKIPIVLGMRVMNTDPSYILGEGMAEFQFDSGAKMVVESPASFRFITGDQVQLNYGRIFVDTEQAPGDFTVQTPQSRIIDLGTQFGVYAGMQGETELHVMEGKTLLIGGFLADSKTVEKVGMGQACRVDLNGNLQSVPFRNHQFVRDIDAELGTAWRGHRTLDLASLVSGSDGYVMKEGVFAIDPLTGARSHSISGKGRLSNAKYNAVADSLFIDGVFVPMSGNVMVTSAGHLFECPPIERYFTRDITVLHGIAALEKDGLRPATAGNVQDPMVNTPRIMLHSNVGITFDLSTIRRYVGSAGSEPCRFRALSETRKLNDKTQEGYLDFYILVDGQIRFEKKAFSSKDQRIELDIPLVLEDEYMSLVVTDCMQKDPVKGGACNNDFLYLIGPSLHWAQ